MAILCKDHKLLFIMVPATGCSALGSVLLKQLGGVWLPESDLKRGTKNVLLRKHNSLNDLLEHGVITRDELRDYTTFATIRNPFDRLASEYERLSGEWMEAVMSGKIKTNWIGAASDQTRADIRRRKEREIERAREGGFEKWVHRRVTSRRFDRLALAACKAAVTRRRLRGYISKPFPLIEGVSRLIRYERLNDDFNDVLREAGVETRLDIPHNNATPGKKPYQEYYSPSTRRLVERYWGREMKEYGYVFESFEPLATNSSYAQAAT
jgi:hypothetical protein